MKTFLTTSFQDEIILSDLVDNEVKRVILHLKSSLSESYGKLVNTKNELLNATAESYGKLENAKDELLAMKDKLADVDKKYCELLRDTNFFGYRGIIGSDFNYLYEIYDVFV